MEERDILLCCPVTELKPDDAVEGSLVDECSECQQKVWLSPANQQYAATLPIICTPCFLDMTGEA